MKIVHNQNIITRQTDNYIQLELSNIASAVQTQAVLVDYYQIDVDHSVLTPGMKNVENYIGKTSTVVYNHIENIPMTGIDNLVSESNFDEELGFEETFTQSGTILPNTIVPKPYDCFIVKNSQVPALYVINNVTPVTVRSNPFIGVSFSLYTRNPEIINQLLRQVKEEYTTTVTAIGLDHSLVIHKTAFTEIQKHVENYRDIADLYSFLFYDRTRSAFCFDGLPGTDTGGCIGYLSADDVKGDLPDWVTDPDHPWHNSIDAISNLHNGDVINPQGDIFYIVDGNPVIAPKNAPYWLIRNYVDNYGNANDYPGAIFDKPRDCCTCVNENCPNKGGRGFSNAEMEEYLKETESVDGIFRQVFIDLTMWKLMFEEGIVVYDDVLTYDTNNFNHALERIYIDSPDQVLSDHQYKRSVLYRMVHPNAKQNPFQYHHPHCIEADPRIAKFRGKHIYYLDYYDSCRDSSLNCGYYDVWDPEFIDRIIHCDLYPVEPESISLCGVPGQCEYAKLYPFNTSLRNVIILGYNNKPIDFDNLELIGQVNLDNYTLIPILLAYYKRYIQELQK